MRRAHTQAGRFGNHCQGVKKASPEPVNLISGIAHEQIITSALSSSRRPRMNHILLNKNYQNGKITLHVCHPRNIRKGNKMAKTSNSSALCLEARAFEAGGNFRKNIDATHIKEL